MSQTAANDNGAAALSAAETPSGRVSPARGGERHGLGAARRGQSRV